MSVRNVAYGAQWFTKQTILQPVSQPSARWMTLRFAFSDGSGNTPVHMALFGYHSSAPFLAPIRPLVPTHVIAPRMALVSYFPLVIFI